MSNAEEHAAAIDAVNESDIAGRTVYVSESLPKEKVAQNKKKYTERKQRNQGSKIYVGNLNFETTTEDLTAAFAAHGEVKDCFLPVDYDGNPRGFGFIQMEEENALAAIEGLNGSELDGRTLNVNKSLPKGQKSAPKREFCPRCTLFQCYRSHANLYVPLFRNQALCWQSVLGNGGGGAPRTL